MKKLKIDITEQEISTGVYSISIGNAYLVENIFNKINNIIQYFSNSPEMFFGFNRTDGMHLTSKQCEKYSKEIPMFFQNYGEMKTIDEYLSVAKLKMDDEAYKMLPFIFNYYLDTTLFEPKINWEFFYEYHSQYMKKRLEDYITDNVTDVVFFYFDSGDFSITFNPKIFNQKEASEYINKAVFDLQENDFKDFSLPK